METNLYEPSSSAILTLPNATDSTPPSGTISVTIPENATAPADVTIDLSAVSDSQSGLYKMRFSNDGSAYSAWENFATSKTWTTSDGEGEKTVYAQISDKVGNIQTLSVNFWLGATLTQIYNESKNSAQKSEAARLAAEEAKTAAENAENAANAAKTSADRAANQTWYNNKSAAQWSYDAYNKANITANDATYIRNTQLPEIEKKINNLQTAVNNIQSLVGPQIQKISGLNGATCTTGTTFSVVIQASGATEYRVKADTGPWSEWTPVDSPVMATGISGTGTHTIYVEARNASGATASGQMVMFKL
jgi:hypothetical protein